MKCRMIQQNKGGFLQLGNSLNIDNSRREGSDAKAEVFGWIMGFINNFSFDQRIQKETEKLKSQIILRLVPNGGVLLCVIYTQTRDGEYKSFDNMFVADSGFDYITVVKRYKSLPKMVAGVHSAYQKMEMYIWVTEV